MEIKKKKKTGSSDLAQISPGLSPVIGHMCKKSHSTVVDVKATQGLGCIIVPYGLLFRAKYLQYQPTFLDDYLLEQPMFFIE